MFSCLKLCYPIGRVVHAGLQPILKNINPCSSVAICAIRVLYRISYDYKSAPAVKYFEILSVFWFVYCFRGFVHRIKLALFCQIPTFGDKQLCFGFKSKRYYG